ncbi:metallophosphatase [Bacteroidia bacterium]|nr:metallophosphatase [Bacteroidia bacterium]
MGFFIGVFVIFTAVNAYLFYRGWEVAKTTPQPVRITYCAVFTVLYLAFIVAMLARNVMKIGMQTVLYDIGTVWMGFMLYLTMFFLVTDAIYWIWRKRQGIASQALVRKIQVVSGYVLVSVLLLYGNYQFNHPKIVEQKIILHNATSLKPQTLKIVAVSDLHLGIQIGKKKLQKYVQLINAQQPDVIVIAGDLIDNNVLPLNVEHMEEELNQLQAPLGVYFCLGNHEYLSGIDDSRAFLAKTNMTVLIDSAAMITDNIQIIGRDDIKRGNGRKSLMDIMHGIAGQARNDKSDDVIAGLTRNPLPTITIVLDHEPYNLEEAEAAGVDLQFSGHTHGGQLFPVNLVVNALFEVSHGYKQKGATHIYVTSGLGLWGPPFRIGSQSEIVVFNLIIN